MGVLESLTLTGCEELPMGWLPASSIAQLPAGMLALSGLSVSGCRSLTEDWLRESNTVGLLSVQDDAGILQPARERDSTAHRCHAPQLHGGIAADTVCIATTCILSAALLASARIWH